MVWTFWDLTLTGVRGTLRCSKNAPDPAIDSRSIPRQGAS
jgi:hypothetical protein